MSYPDYSVVVVDVTTGGITEPVVFVHFDELVSKKVYRDAILAGNRAFYYEKPKPTLFQRNDTQPIIDATVAEAAILASAIPQGFTTDSVADAKVDEFFDYLDKQYTMLDENLNAIQSGSYRAGERIGKRFFNVVNNFFYNRFMPWAYSVAGGVVAEVTVGNYTYKILHDGFGGFTESRINNCPEEGTVMSTINNADYTTITAQYGVSIVLGTYDETLIHDGNCGYASSGRVYDWKPDGTIVGTATSEEQLAINIKSDGVGGYYMSLVNPDGGGGTGGDGNSDCTEAGIENEELRSPTQNVTWDFDRNNEGQIQTFVIGSYYTSFTSDGNCGYDSEVVADYMEYGSLVHIDMSDNGYVTTQYKSTGSGGVFSEVDDQTPPEEPTPESDYDAYCVLHPEDEICQCQLEGEIMDRLGVLYPPRVSLIPLNFIAPQGITINIENAGQTLVSQAANGECGLVDIPSTEMISWNLQGGDILAHIIDEGMETITDCAFDGAGGVVCVENYTPTPLPRLVNQIAILSGRLPMVRNGNVEEGIWISGSEFFVLGGAGFEDGLKPRGLQNGDYQPQWQDVYQERPSENGPFTGGNATRFACEAVGPRMVQEIGYGAGGYTPFEWWSSADALEAEVSSSSATHQSKLIDRQKMLLLPASSPYTNGTETVSGEANRHPVSSLPSGAVIQTGLIYYGRRIAWNPADIGNPQTHPYNARINLKWYSEEYLISINKIPQDSRWNAPTVSVANSMRSRLGISGGNGAGGTTFESHVRYVCPNFQQSLPMMRNSGQAFAPVVFAAGPNPARINTYALGSVVGGKQRYQLKQYLIKYDGKGGIVWLPLS